MKFGTIKCLCGKEFYFETVSDVVECVYCGEKHDVSQFPELVEEEVILDGEEVQSDLQGSEG